MIRARVILFLLAPLFAFDLAAQTNRINPLTGPFNQFAFDLLRQRAIETPSANIFVSPVSLAVSLALLHQGAGGSGEQELRTALHLGGLSLEEARQGCRELFAALRSTAGVELAMAQSAWVDDAGSVEAKFLNLAQTDFASEIRRVDFANPSACNQIQQWVQKQTRGRIKDAPCPAGGAGSPLVLINAVYFKGSWQHPFQKQRSLPAPFHGARKTSHPVFMKQMHSFGYAETNRSQQVQLRFRDGQFVADFILPEKAETLTNLIARLQFADLEKSSAALTQQEVILELPRYEFSTESKLNKTLQSMGVQQIFRGGALPGISAQTYISGVNQKAYINVNEEGAEAAAVTTIAAPTAAAPPRFAEATFDRPFLFAIRDARSGLILFLGAIFDLP